MTDQHRLDPPVDVSIPREPPTSGAVGQLANAHAVDHGQRLQPKLYNPCAGVWCLVGNGLSNQSFVEGPDGIIAVDSGECLEEMQAAIAALREHTSKPIVACIYTHFHYVAGTQALLPETGGQALEVYGHADIARNLTRVGGAIAPKVARGLVYQFGTALPDEGPDALLHCGLGLSLRNPAHAPFTLGHIPVNQPINEPVELTIAGLRVDITPAPADADDSVTVWFPELQTCINNLVWPSLFNIYAIRGEPYRDPAQLIEGIDYIRSLDAQHLICTHGPPLSGDAIGPAVTDARDAIQYLYDQTIRGANQGQSIDAIAARVQLPKAFQRSYFTRQFYGLAEHHVRQIYTGLFGWFDESAHKLLPTVEHERNAKLVAGFGGKEQVLKHIDQALEDDDLRWALELGSWLPDAQDRNADILRTIAQRTPSANVRNWCLTRALELEGGVDLARLRQHRFRRANLLAQPTAEAVLILRTLIDPNRALDVNDKLAWHFADGTRIALHIRNGVAAPTTANNCELMLGLSLETWADVLCGSSAFGRAVDQGLIATEGPWERIAEVIRCFDHPTLKVD